MTVSRCPQRCNDPKCRVCGGGGYVWGDGSPATPEQMLEQLQSRKVRHRPRIYSRRRR